MRCFSAQRLKESGSLGLVWKSAVKLSRVSQRRPVVCDQITRSTTACKSLQSTMLPLLRSRYLLQQTIARPVAAFSTAVDAIKAEGSPADGEKGRKFRFKKMRARRFIVADQRKRNGELETKAAQENLPWRIVGATYDIFFSPVTLS